MSVSGIVNKAVRIHVEKKKAIKKWSGLVSRKRKIACDGCRDAHCCYQMVVAHMFEGVLLANHLMEKGQLNTLEEISEHGRDQGEMMMRAGTVDLSLVPLILSRGPLRNGSTVISRAHSSKTISVRSTRCVHCHVRRTWLWMMAQTQDLLRSVGHLPSRRYQRRTHKDWWSTSPLKTRRSSPRLPTAQIECWLLQYHSVRQCFTEPSS